VWGSSIHVFYHRDNEAGHLNSLDTDRTTGGPIPVNNFRDGHLWLEGSAQPRARPHLSAFADLSGQSQRQPTSRCHTTIDQIVIKRLPGDEHFHDKHRLWTFFVPRVRFLLFQCKSLAEITLPWGRWEHREGCIEKFSLAQTAWCG